MPNFFGVRKSDRFIVQGRNKNIVQKMVDSHKKKGCVVLTNPEIREETTYHGDRYYLAVLKRPSKEKAHS